MTAGRTDDHITFVLYKINSGKCSSELCSSKINPHPNFLIMAGDRYGWIPLPYLIKKTEYETIVTNIEKEEDKELLNTWYKLDENQIPASYVLSERKK